jgi:transposase
VLVPWARPDTGFTLLFEALLMAMLAQMPVKAVAGLVGEHDTRLWRLVHHHLDAARAYAWRLGFDGFFHQPRELAEDYLERWWKGVVRSRLQPIVDFAQMIGEHWEGVLRWHWTRINNGVLEGTNSLIQASKRRARGYRNKPNLIAMIYLIAGRLDISPIHTN